MPTTGSYQFKLAAKASGGVIADGLDLEPGEWAWIDRTQDYEVDGIKAGTRWLMIYACCPDCKQHLCLYRKRGENEGRGHDIDAQGNISPSVLHTWVVAGVEQCGFHTQPTKLLGFIDLRGT